MQVEMTNEEYAEWKQDRYSHYKDRIADLRERAASSSDFVDNHLISVSSGVVGLSFTFLNFLTAIMEHRPILYLSWGCFIITILLVFASHELLQRHWDIAVKKWHAWFNNDRSRDPDSSSVFGNINTIVMWTAKLLFIAGFITLVTFIGINLPT
jgi:hypothetical protein